MDNNTKLIEIEQDMPGFNHFFGSWVCTGKINILIDAGPANSAQRLVDSLVSMGLDTLDYVLLTHIHIDHCGGLGKILQHYPTARVVCHNKGVKHIADPSNLWEGSLKVLGDIAKMYGRPDSVEKDKIIPHTECDIQNLKIVETPGHAVHHLSYIYNKSLFAGEAGGNFFMINGKEYLRPATPPRFFFDVCLNSVDRLLALENQPIYYVHCGLAKDSHQMLKRFRDQLFVWKEIIGKELKKGDDDIVNRCQKALIDQDLNLFPINTMDPDTQKREKTFMTNSIKGFVGFLKENG